MSARLEGALLKGRGGPVPVVAPGFEVSVVVVEWREEVDWTIYRGVRVRSEVCGDRGACLEGVR